MARTGKGYNLGEPFTLVPGEDMTGYDPGTLITKNAAGNAIRTTGAKNRVVGVLMDAPLRYDATRPDSISVYPIKNAQQLPMIAAGATTAGSTLKPGANGRADDTALANGDFVLGTAKTAAAAAGEGIVADVSDGGYLYHS